MLEPPTIYGGTSGFERGIASSEARAVSDDASGRTSERQAIVYAEVRSARDEGVTWHEVAAARGLHHGQATSALSILHRQGHIVRLAETRNRCGIYVLPEHAHGRETVAQGRRYEAHALARDVPLHILERAVLIAQGAEDDA